MSGIDLNKVKKEVEKGTYDTFRNLLKRCIGVRTQTQFAGETGLSRGNINRLLNQDVIQKPSYKTLAALASHMNSVSLNDLMLSCGYEMPDIETVAVAVSDEIKKAFSNIAGSIVHGLDDKIFDSISLPYVESKYKWSEIKTRELTPFISLKGVNYSLWECGWNYGDLYGRTYMAFGYTDTKDDNIVICDFTMDADTLKSLPDSDYLDKIDDSSSSIIRNGSVWDLSCEEMLLESTFGSQIGKYTVTAIGCGFYYKETPAGFRNYVLSNAKYFCTSKENQKLFQRLVDTNDDPDEIFKDYSGFVDGIESGTGCVVADILMNKTGQEFIFMEKDKYADEDAEDDSCVICPNDDIYSDDELFDLTVLKHTYEAAVALGIKDFGIVYHKCIYNKSTKQVYNTDTFNYTFMQDDNPIIYDDVILDETEKKAKEVDDYYSKISEDADSDDTLRRETYSKSMKAGRIACICLHAKKRVNDEPLTQKMVDFINEEYEAIKKN